MEMTKRKQLSKLRDKRKFLIEELGEHLARVESKVSDANLYANQARNAFHSLCDTNVKIQQLTEKKK